MPEPQTDGGRGVKGRDYLREAGPCHGGGGA